MTEFKKKIEKLKNDGVLILPSMIDVGTLNLIKKQIKSLSKVTFNDVLGSLIISENYWIEHLGIHSELIFQIILDE